MFSIIVEIKSKTFYGCGKDSFDSVEWPPSPARLFYTMVNSCFSFVEKDYREECLKSLEWLEGQPPPMIYAPEAIENTVKTYDPIAEIVNGGIGKRENIHKYLNMKYDTIIYSWNQNINENIFKCLSTVLNFVPYFGKAKSFATMSISYEFPEIHDKLLCYEPSSSRNGFFVRNLYSGLLRDLINVYDKNTGRILPHGTSYYKIKQNTNNFEWNSPFDSESLAMLECKFENGSGIDQKDYWKLSRDIRKTIIGFINSSEQREQKYSCLFPIITGHDFGSENQIKKHHLAIIPMSFTGRLKYSDGTLKGVCFAIPKDTDCKIKNKLEIIINSWAEANPKFKLGRTNISIKPVGIDPIKSLRWKESYARCSDIWETVSPVALSRTPKKVTRKSLEDQLIKEFEKQNIVPLSVEISSYPFLFGSTRCQDYSFENGGRKKYMIHARVKFKNRINGPVIVGNGIHCGIGLFLPRD